MPAAPTVSSTPTPETPTILPSATATAIATPTAMPQPAALAPLQPLQNTEVVDRPLRNVRALTDGTIKYRIAQWGPDSEWIAAIPQDGPGMDLINSATGKVTRLLTDTYVLEPNWTAALSPEGSRDEPSLAVQQVRDGQDILTLLYIRATGDRDPPRIRSEDVATSTTPIRAPTVAAERVVYSTDDQLVAVGQFGAATVISSTGALVTALSAGPRSALAWTPAVVNLEDVQTFLTSWASTTIATTPLSRQGEGLWLPRWAPDGNKLALTSIAGRIVSTTLDGTQRYDLGPGDLPAWSRDSAHIAYAGTSAGLEFTSRDIHIVDWQGHGPRLRLTRANDEQFFTSPSWSPDGQRLAFVEIDSGQVFVGDVP